MEGLEIRSATPNDRDRLLSILNRAFSYDYDHEFDFDSLLPHLFTDTRIGDHQLALFQGRIIGVVGVYPYTISMGHTQFNTFGIGQVATDPDHRGRGVMSTLLDSLERLPRKSEAAFSWLWGDHNRYKNFSWTTGGRKEIFSYCQKCLPAPCLDQQEAFRFNQHSALIAKWHKSSHTRFHMTDDELAKLFESEEISGEVLNNSFILSKGQKNMIYATDGDERDLSQLLANRLSTLAGDQAGETKLHVELPFYTRNHSALLRNNFWRYLVRPSAMFRIESVSALLRSLADYFSDDLPFRDDALSFTLCETGETFSLHIENGRVSSDTTKQKNHFELKRFALTEVFFGVHPICRSLPQLPRHSPFHYLLPLKLHIPRIFKL